MSRADRIFLHLVLTATGGATVLAAPLAITLFPRELQLALHSSRELALACASVVYRVGSELPPLGLVVLALAAASLAHGATWLARTLSRTRQVRTGHRQVRAPGRLRRVAAELGLARDVLCYDDVQAAAYCAGLLHPRIWVSRAAVFALGRNELAAVLAHEAHHLSRRDPLRLLIARVLASSLFALPIVRAIAQRFAVAAELDADRAALDAVGLGPLAGALATLAPQPRVAGAALSASSASRARVAQMCGDPEHRLLPAASRRARWLTAMSLAAALALALGQAARANVLPGDLLPASRAAAEMHICPLPRGGILL